MATERTLSILKPDATRRNLTGKINTLLEGAGLRIVAQKRLHLTQAQAEGFYAVHRERGFFGELVAFMISGPVVVQLLEGEDAVPAYRAIMGATNPANADAGTIRKELALYKEIYPEAFGATPAISIAAFSSLSEPCTVLASIDSASSLRMVPASALAGLVAPMMAR